MAAFSYQHHQPLFLESVFLPNLTTPVNIKNSNMSAFFEDGNNNSIDTTNCFSSQLIYPSIETFHQTPLDVRFHETSHLDHSSRVATSDNETSVTKKLSTDSSTVVDKLETGEQVTQKLTPMDKKRRNTDGSSLNSARSKDTTTREVKSKRQKICSGDMKQEEKKPKAEKKVPEEPPTGYIHVRARRGQATDSHSLAERVRREKISERMKILQHLVPGCDKVTGKALMLDEIINYVQSLQNQVEFLSMKLASINPLFYAFEMDLDAFMVRPERSSGVSPPLAPLQQCSPIQPAAFADATTTATATAATIPTSTFDTAHIYRLVDNPTSHLLQGMRPADFTTQDCGSLMWDVEEQRQKLHNPSGFPNNLCSLY